MLTLPFLIRATPPGSADMLRITAPDGQVRGYVRAGDSRACSQSWLVTDAAGALLATVRDTAPLDLARLTLQLDDAAGAPIGALRLPGGTLPAAFGRLRAQLWRTGDAQARFNCVESSLVARLLRLAVERVEALDALQGWIAPPRFDIRRASGAQGAVACLAATGSLLELNYRADPAAAGSARVRDAGEQALLAVGLLALALVSAGRED